MEKLISSRVWFIIPAVLTAQFAFGSITVQLMPSSSSAAVGTTVTWTATATDSANSSATFTYQFSVGTSTSNLQVRRDFSSVNQFPWTEADQEGTYDIDEPRSR
jgi:plastocyanin